MIRMISNDNRIFHVEKKSVVKRLQEDWSICKGGHWFEGVDYA